MERSHIEKRLEDHMNNDERNFDALIKLVDKISSALTEFTEIREESAKIKAELESVKTNIIWIIRIGAGAWGVSLVLFTAMVYIVREAITK